MEATSGKEYALATKKISAIVWDYALPAIVGMLVNALYNIVDRVFIGHGVGAMAISGLAITLPVVNLTSSLGLLVGTGASSRISINLGKKDKKRAEQILGNSLLLLIIFNIIIVLVFLLNLKSILFAFGASEQTYPYARDYLQIVISGNFFMSMCFSFNNMMRASGYPQKAMYTMLIGAGLNVVLDPIFIFVFGMGIRGVAVATVISMFIGMMFVMHHFRQKDSLIQLKKENIRFNKSIIFAIVTIGMSPFLMQVAASIVAVLMNASLWRYGGDLAVGAFGIYNSLAMLVVLVVIGLNQGMQPIIGYNYGAQNYGRVRKTLSYGIKVATVITSMGFLLGLFFPRLIAKAFTSDKHLLNIAEQAIRLATLSYPIIGMQIVASHYFQSIGQAQKSIILSLSRQVLFLIPAIWLLPQFFALKGLWLASPVADVISTLLAFYFLRMQWRTLHQLEQRSAMRRE